MNTDIVRVVRVLEYTGPEKDLKRALSQNAVKGYQKWGDIECREAILGDRTWEVVGEMPAVVEQIEHKGSDFGKIGGYFEDGSAETFHVWPDDATRTWHVTRNGKTLGYGNTIEQALKNAALGKGY